MARYLLIVNDQYYPSFGDRDWYGTFESEEDAVAVGNKIRENDHSQSYEVIDLQHWLELKCSTIREDNV